MDIDLNALTLAALLTTAGATVLAAIVTGIVQVLKGLFTGLAGNEARAAAAISAIIVVLLAVQAVQLAQFTVGVPLILAAVFAWYGVTRLAMAVYDDISGEPAGLRKQL